MGMDTVRAWFLVLIATAQTTRLCIVERIQANIQQQRVSLMHRLNEFGQAAGELDIPVEVATVKSAVMRTIHNCRDMRMNIGVRVRS